MSHLCIKISINRNWKACLDSRGWEKGVVAGETGREACYAWAGLFSQWIYWLCFFVDERARCMSGARGGGAGSTLVCGVIDDYSPFFFFFLYTASK